ncbi:MAG TPA: hypothetical protein VGG22_04095 [Candidatus Baltobacteraceae bacterium]|jgi:hypothetical protein
MSFVILALSTILAFGCVIGFEATLASFDARATALHLEIAGQLQTLRAGLKIEESAAVIESRLAALRVTESLRWQIAALFGDLEEIAERRKVQVTAFRHEGSTRLEVSVEGKYSGTLEALADLSSSRVAAQASLASFERANGHVRAAFSLDILGVGNARTHVP